MKVENYEQFSLKMLHCEAGVFPVCTAYGYMVSWPFFTLLKMHMRMNLDHVASGGETIICKFNYWPLAVNMPPTKVCPQCKAAVPAR